MQPIADQTTPSSPRTSGKSDLSELLRGYRFTVCDRRDAAAEALDVRRHVYVESSGYDVPVPDEYDRRSWLLLARHDATGQAVGSLRVTPRFAGSLECEEYFTLPRRLQVPKAFELSRFAILPEHRKGTTFLPVVSLGLFKLVFAMLQRFNGHYMVVCSKPERVWTYEWLRFRRTGLTTRYEKLKGAEHELLWEDFQYEARHVGTHPFSEIFLGSYREALMPTSMPPLGLVPESEPVRRAVGE
jgi:N-acyl-L-homoserine lactone synthetase